jgi:CheY-like chemotaxis protein
MEEASKLGKILIVDDNEDVLFALNLLLEPYAEKIKVATTPDRIEHFMTTFQPDLILLDMNFSRDAISGQKDLRVWSKYCNSTRRLLLSL